MFQANCFYYFDSHLQFSFCKVTHKARDTVVIKIHSIFETTKIQDTYVLECIIFIAVQHKDILYQLLQLLYECRMLFIFKQ